MPSPSSPTLRSRLARRPSTAGFSPVDIRLPAAASELAYARERTTEAASRFGLDPRASYEFVYAVNEAVTNAIKHGSPEPDGTISVRLHAEDEFLVCAVRDSGPFIFRPSKSDPEAAESGRGFALMSSLTDDLDLIVEPDATVVRLRKRRVTGAPVAGA